MTISEMCQPIPITAVFEGKDKHMIMEANRLKSFVQWPFADAKCNKESMARSGFYHCNINGEVDGVRCFCCLKELDGWDRDDDPWTEHRRNNNCYFANLGKSQDQLSVKEFLKVIEERQINLMNKRFQTKQELEEKTKIELGFNMENELQTKKH